MTQTTLTWSEALNVFQDNVKKGKKTFLFLHTYDVHSPYLIENAPLLYSSQPYKDIPLTSEDYYHYSSELGDYIKKQLSVQLTTDEFHNKTPVYRRYLSELTKIDSNSTKAADIVINNVDFEQYILDYNYTRHILDSVDSKESLSGRIEYIRALYDQKIHELDNDDLANLFAFLNNEKVKNNTILLITSDHGEEFMEHGKIYHVTPYDPNLRIPFIMYIPGVKAKEISKQVQNVDIVPTLLDLVGIIHPYSFQGVSLVRLIEGKPFPDRFLLANGLDLNSTILRYKNWKLHVSNQNDEHVPYELYDINRDPDETTNVLFSHIDISKKMIQDYTSFKQQWKQRIH